MSNVTLPPLPYPYEALEPHIDAETMHVHHDKHHAKYVDTCVSMIKGTDMESWDAIQILRAAHGNNQALFNNAAQAWNHGFYWSCMKPNGGGVPTGRIAAMIDASFGSFQAFREQFTNAGVTAFGSGWAWLVWSPEGLKVCKTIGADTPLTDPGVVPLLTMDVWEHAYYLKYKNLRPAYIEAFIDNLINWEFVESNLPATV